VTPNALLHPVVEAVILFALWEIFMFEHARMIDADGTTNEAAKRYLSMKSAYPKLIATSSTMESPTSGASFYGPINLSHGCNSQIVTDLIHCHHVA
jgi:hypothetical protein